MEALSGIFRKPFRSFSDMYGSGGKERGQMVSSNSTSRPCIRQSEILSHLDMSRGWNLRILLSHIQALNPKSH